ncbi:carbohydrate binding family 9 domain-containing protein [Arenibacter sp. BSSL-BM3]|uniref:Carbohydrate binding family 9 domain-containing protein n=1 Tax=Arenibacter arenosicollis TaxID=2762274 RepID=A0ABR7QS61_9FLAO|nr:carbohydrate binding family 9 domain-containing protein [Arenibacter arenosicollis]MBC8770023.1 carbohydrate binding family 9 domain-containing protein [Arenibacter arenosicollis]
MKLSILLATLFLYLIGNAQNLPGTKLKIKKFSGEIVLDGILDEVAWKEADVADNWYQNFPVDSLPSPFQTEARLTYNDEFLYVSFVCYDDDTPDVVSTLRRDFNYAINDNVSFIFGPYNDRLNGYFFNVTAIGAQREGTVSSGGNGENAFNIYWDNKWYSKVVRYKDKWIAELAIPFKSFKYKSDVKEWNVTFDRLDKKRNIKSAWVRTPRQFYTGTFAYAGQLVWEDPIPEASSNISLIPYISGGAFQDRELEPIESSTELQTGFDAKIGITPSMNLDLTVNPDFSQIEVDEQILNLSRFEFRFPERRQFFLENSDLFDNAGFDSARPFFSRRIGIIQDTSGIAQKVPIMYGARLSGTINEKWRLGVMNMQTKKMLELGLPAQNYTVATVQRMFHEQSSFSMTFVNKQSLGVSESDSLKYYHPSIFGRPTMDERVRPNTYNRVIDADLVLRSKDNRWYHSSFLAQSFDDKNKAKTMSGSAFFQYSDRSLLANLGTFFVNKNFNAEVGYVPGSMVYPGQMGYYSEVAYKIYPENNSLLYAGPQARINDTYLPNGTLVDREYAIGYAFEFKNSSNLSLDVEHVFQQLTFDFNPVNDAESRKFLEGEEYRWNTISATYQSNTTKKMNFLLNSTYGGFYNGTNLNIAGQLDMRFQPYVNIAMRFDYNNLKLEEDYGRAELILLGPKLDVTFTDKLFFTGYYQYNNLTDNMNLNARFQWRYKPASDFYIVYTENYFPSNFTSKNRALVFKLTYWINL